jgi:TRAP-type C4-dicarboxylate transport system substrate-binding protein
VYHGLGLFVTNRKTFATFTPKEKKIYIALAAKYGVVATDLYVEQQREVRETAAKRSIQFWKPGKDFNDALAKFRAEDLPRLAEDFKARGVAVADKLMKQHLAAIAKWVKIVEKTGSDRAALIKVIEDEIYSKVKF